MLCRCGEEIPILTFNLFDILVSCLGIFRMFWIFELFEYHNLFQAFITDMKAMN